MGHQRSTGNRTTSIKRGDHRAVGFYEQTADWPSVATLYATIARTLGGRHSVTVTGHVDIPGRVSYDDLVGLATVGPDGRFGVSMADVLATVRLSTRAEVLIMHDRVGDSIAIPVRDVLQVRDAQLTFGTARAALRHTEGGPVRLDVSGWTTASAPLTVASIHAATFGEFVGCC